jgi:hypothetical protein
MVFRPEQGVFRVGGWTAGIGGLVFVIGGSGLILQDGLVGLIPVGIGIALVYQAWHVLNRHGYYEEIKIRGDVVLLRKSGGEQQVQISSLKGIGEELDGEGGKFMELRFRGEYPIRFEPSHEARVFMSALSEAAGVAVKRQRT